MITLTRLPPIVRVLSVLNTDTHLRHVNLWLRNKRQGIVACTCFPDSHSPPFATRSLIGRVWNCKRLRACLACKYWANCRECHMKISSAEHLPSNKSEWILIEIIPFSRKLFRFVENTIEIYRNNWIILIGIYFDLFHDKCPEIRWIGSLQ